MAINESELFEKEPDSGPKAGIIVHNLRKVFPHLTKSDVVAVNGVSFKVRMHSTILRMEITLKLVTNRLIVAV